MNNRTLHDAYKRLKVSDNHVCYLTLENGDRISFNSLDFGEGGKMSDHVWLSAKQTDGKLHAFACYDLRSIAGITG